MASLFASLSHNRLRILGVFCVLVFAVFIVRLFELQVIHHSKYVTLANQEQLKRLTIPAKRGELYVMDGGVPAKVVLNETVYTAFADPEIVDKPDELVAAIKEIAGGNARDNLKDLVTKEGSRYEIVATKVTRKQAELLKKRELRGLGFQATSQRVYPEGQLASQTLGFVNTEGQGVYGVEGYLNDRLIGTDGLLQSVTDVSNVPLTIGKNNIDQPAKDGDDIALTIDRNVQSYTEQALAKGLKETGATHGSAIVMDPSTGKVLSMANLPTYNPTDYSKVTDAARFNNGVTMTPYEAGSVFKTFTIAVGIDKGVIQPNSTFYNTDSIKIEDRIINNALKGYTGTITMQDALNYSLNTGMVTIAERLGGSNGTITRSARDTIYDYYYNHFGLGQTTGIEVSSEASGRIISPKEQEGNAVRYSNMVFGQGLDITMVQVAAGFGSIINGGTYYQPTVLEGVVQDDGSIKAEPAKASRSGVVSKSTSDKVRDMTHKARQVFPSGDRPGYYIGGKTGTTQTIENGKYVLNQTIGTYLGYGGTKAQPKYVIMVQVSGKGMNLEGNLHAKPIFTDISNWLIDYMKLPPEN